MDIDEMLQSIKKIIDMIKNKIKMKKVNPILKEKTEFQILFIDIDDGKIKNYSYYLKKMTEIENKD